MLSRSILEPILGNEALTRGLADPEARILIEWLVYQAEKIATNLPGPEKLPASVEKMCRRARGISRFVVLWSNPASRGAAFQLAATERYSWPLPSDEMDPCELMLDILSHETPIPA